MGENILRLGVPSDDTYCRVREALDRQRQRTPQSSDIITVSGALVDSRPAHPGSFGMSAWDVSTSLAQICRFGGHTPRLYSVAEHAALVSRVAQALNLHVVEQFAGLHHDDVEALTGDIVRPRKTSRDYEFESLVCPGVADAFLPAEMPMRRMLAFEIATAIPGRIVHAVDDLVLAAEMIAFWGPALERSADAYASRSAYTLGIVGDPVDLVFRAWDDSMQEAQAYYLRRHRELLSELYEYGLSTESRTKNPTTKTEGSNEA